MNIKWQLEFQVLAGEPVVRDESRWLHNKLVTVKGLSFHDGNLAFIICDAQETTQSHSPVVYRASDKVEWGGDVIPDRKELNAVLPKVIARARAEALVRSAKLAGLPHAVSAVRAMLRAQEEFVKGVNDIYEALDEMERHGAKATEAK